MPVSLTNNIDNIANFVFQKIADTVIKILDICLKRTDSIEQIIGVLPETLSTIQKLADNINNDKSIIQHNA